MNRYRLAEIERYIFEVFAARRRNKLLTKELFDGSPQYANADLVRAFEDLEKKWRLLVRYTDEGDDWIQLTPEGVEYVGSDEFVTIEEPEVMPHPPKSLPD
ncbi:MAG TPA: hypothetical protein VFQ92_11455 [Blastocatellia bacterium]|nr:hypothetical protein [Blastocatellia bacterium]